MNLNKIPSSSINTEVRLTPQNSSIQVGINMKQGSDVIIEATILDSSLDLVPKSNKSKIIGNVVQFTAYQADFKKTTLATGSFESNINFNGPTNPNPNKTIKCKYISESGKE